jgi:hypothetical protein
MVKISIRNIDAENHIGGGKYALTVAISGTYRPASHKGEAGILVRVSKERVTFGFPYPAKQQQTVCTRQPCTSRMPRDFHNMYGAYIHAQKNCHTILSHHSQPFEHCILTSAPVPFTV